MPHCAAYFIDRPAYCRRVAEFFGGAMDVPVVASPKPTVKLNRAAAPHARQKCEASSVRWIEISVQCHPEAVESVSELLSEIAAGGVAIEEPYELEDDGQRYRHIPGALVTLHGYIPEDADAPRKQERLATALWHLKSLGDHFIGDSTTRTVDDEDWAETWKAHFHVTRIGRRTVIQPTWREYTPESPDDIIIAIDPGMAFGTGTHPTTRMCLEALEDVTQPGDDVLDVGTGSGILTIAALRLGAARALAIDISTIAVRTTQENIALNDLTDRAEVTQGTLGLGPDGEPTADPPRRSWGKTPWRC